MTAVQLLRAALEGLRETNYLNFYTVFATDLALSEAGRPPRSGSRGNPRSTSVCRAHWGIVLFARDIARQRRASADGGQIERHRCRRQFLAFARFGASARGLILGTAVHHEPRPIAARPGPHS